MIQLKSANKEGPKNLMLRFNGICVTWPVWHKFSFHWRIKLLIACEMWAWSTINMPSSPRKQNNNEWHNNVRFLCFYVFLQAGIPRCIKDDLKVGRYLLKYSSKNFTTYLSILNILARAARVARPWLVAYGTCESRALMPHRSYSLPPVGTVSLWSD